MQQAGSALKNPDIVIRQERNQPERLAVESRPGFPSLRFRRRQQPTPHAWILAWIPAYAGMTEEWMLRRCPHTVIPAEAGIHGTLPQARVLM